MVINKSSVSNETELLGYLKQQTKDNKRLYHYTSFDSLLYILKGKAFRLTRTDLLNDRKEKDFSGKHDYYVMSMTGDKEYVSMWSMYGKKSGIKIRIDFPLNLFEKCFVEQNIYSDGECKTRYYSSTKRLFDPSPSPTIEKCAIRDVVYLNKARTQYIHNEKPFPSIKASEPGIEELAGFIKYDAWEFERETRARVYCDPYNKDGDHVFVALSDELISDIRVTFNPWISDSMKDEMSAILAKRGIMSRNSGFDGQVDEL